MSSCSEPRRKGAKVPGSPARTITTGSEVTVENIHLLREQLLAAGDRGVTVDLSPLSKGDLTLAQLLCALHSSVAAKGGSYRLIRDGEGILAGIAAACGQRSDGCGRHDEDNCVWHYGEAR